MGGEGRSTRWATWRRQAAARGIYGIIGNRGHHLGKMKTMASSGKRPKGGDFSRKLPIKTP